MSLTTREFLGSDLPAVADLLDETLGHGFWDLDPSKPGSHRVALDDGAVIGFASAVLVDSVREAPALVAPIGLVRIVAVDARVRRRGVATRLTKQVCDACCAAGARDLAAYAWVHGPAGIAPLAGVLESLGFSFEQRLADFYSAPGTGLCPACGGSPCACPADLYVRVPAEDGI